MAKRIDHEQRKREIAEKALVLFSQVGYDNVSLIMIAAASGVSRTAVYQYFCSKREVLDAAIVSVTDGITAACRGILRGPGSNVEKLQLVCHHIADAMYDNKRFLIAIFDFVIAMVRTGADMNAAIMNFTQGAHGAIAMLVRRGKVRGEFAPVLEVERAVDVIYAEFESCAMRIVLGHEKTATAAKRRLSDTIRAIAAWR